MRVPVLIAATAVCLTWVAASGRPAGAASVPVPPGQDHACIVGPAPTGGIDWSQLRNPILSYVNHGVKDQALQWSGGEWHMLFSELTATSTAPHVQWDVAVAHSHDLVHWTSPQVIARGAASPDIVRDPKGRFVVTYQTMTGAEATDQLEYRIAGSGTLNRWSAAHALGPGLASRMIDAALAFTGHGVILGFKAGSTGGTQHFEIAWAPSLRSAFHLVGQPTITIFNDTIENYEFLTVGGSWHLIATSNVLDQPYVFTIGAGDPNVPTTWLTWSVGRQLQIPNQLFDTGKGITSVGFEHANSAFLCVGPGGEDYLTYAASTELTAYGGWGHARIGLARSNDLVTWQVPPS